MDCKAGCLAKTKCSHTDHCGEGGEEDGCFVRIQQLPSCAVLVLQPVHNEDTEIIPDAKNKGGQDDVDNIELNSQNSHQSQDDYPAD